MKWQRITEDQRTRSLRVLLLLANWIGGGAERVAIHLMNGLPAHWDIRLGLLNTPGNAYAHLLDPAQIHVAPGSYDFGRPNAELFNVSTIAAGAVEAPRAFRNIIREARPDVVISFLKGTAILTWLALAGMRDRPRWIAREGNNIRATALAESPNALVRGASLKLTGIAYRRADAVIANASAMAGDLTAMFGVTRHRVHAIPNPVDLPGIAKAAAFPIPAGAGRPFLLSVGRLEYQKGFDVLLAAFAASQARLTHDLVILGTGSLGSELRRMANALGIGERVRFTGFQQNPHAWMARADAFVMASRWEGFPNAAVEAMAAGAPVILADCDYGPREMIEHGRSGMLFPVEDRAALTQLIDRAVSSQRLRAHLSAEARLRAWRFSLDRIAGRYASLIKQVADPIPAPAGALTLTPT